ncbi:MlaD family protein [Pontibacter silvestris]|uniref:MlaD family protein n=1 Tax=Pontibacter silvestris TaxID=2305183 RepID=A0ABW4X5Q5_9BACT|nr:MlaD family protein [Pontibacter silvestris]MCC9137909.1 MlaD family protein [Pontibacter silvestris]
MKISKEIKVALLGIVALVILYLGFTFLKGSDVFSDSKTFYVVYDNVDGLSVSNPVILNGVQIGSVQDITLLTSKDNSIRVELDVLEDVQVGDSTIASLASSDLLGSKAIVLYPGNSRTMYDGGETLIPLHESSITDMISSKTVPVIDRVDTTLTRVNRLLDDDTRSSIQGILENTQATSAAINDMLRANQQNINSITSNISELTSSLRQTERQINRLAGNMADITDSLKQVQINKLVNDADKAVTELETAVAKLNSNEGSIGRMMNDDELYQNLERSTDALNLLLRDIQVNPKRYVQFSVFGRRDKYKVDETGRVITIDEVKDMQDEHPQNFREPVPDTVYVPVPDTSRTTIKMQNTTPGANRSEQ